MASGLPGRPNRLAGQACESLRSARGGSLVTPGWWHSKPPAEAKFWYVIVAVPRRQVSVSSTAPLSQRSDMVVFFKGHYLPANQAHVGVMTHALAYGTGCFEGIRGYWNPDAKETYIFRVREHFARMHRSARVLNITLPFTVDE